MNYFEFSIIIKEKRIEKKLTQKDMSKLMSLRQSRYNLIENGRAEPRFHELVLLCNILDIDFTKITKIKEASYRPHYD